MENVLRLLMRRGEISGEEISAELGVTRAAVWKKIELLRAGGIEVDSAPRRGYRLASCGDALFAPVIEEQAGTRWAGRQCVYLPSVDSTNAYARKIAAQGAAHGTLVLAGEQTAGRGRRGRAWQAKKDENIMMTLLLRPRIHPSRTALLSLLCAVAVARAIESAAGLEARIKWPNDVVVQGRKVCGMLLEMTANEQEVESVAAGVGINVHQRIFPAEFAKTAASLDGISGRTLSRASLVCAFLRAFEARYDALEAGGEAALMEEYRALSATLGRDVRVLGLDGEWIGRAQAIDATGALVVQGTDGAMRTVLAGDVSVRGLMGYV